MWHSLKLGKLFGIRIFVHGTFFLLPILVFFVNWRIGQASLAIYAVTMLFAIFGCVVLHELGHALMARRYGIGTRDITLYPIGGVARLEGMSEEPWEEFWIALAGPAVNVAIALILAGTLFLSGFDFARLWQSIEEGNILAHLMVANTCLVIFNLLPAFPMDGGRVVRALLTIPLGPFQATIVAASLGIAMSIMFVLLGIGIFAMFGNPVFILVGMFVFFLGQQELVNAWRRKLAFRHEAPLEVVAVNEVTFDWPVKRPAPQFSGFTWDTSAGAWIEWRNGRPVHTISVE